MRGYSGSNPSRYQFTGQYIDNTAPWGHPYYYNARYYDPQIGTFLGCPQGADTLVPDPGNVQAYNRYLYALGNPIRYNDPSGHRYATYDSGGGGGIDPLTLAVAAEERLKAGALALATYLGVNTAANLTQGQETYVTPATNVPGSIVLQDPVAYANQVQVTGTPLNAGDLPTIPPPSQPAGITTQQLVTPLPGQQRGNNIYQTSNYDMGYISALMRVTQTPPGRCHI